MFLSIVPTSDLRKGRHTFLILHVTAVRMLVILSHQAINDIKMTRLVTSPTQSCSAVLSTEGFFVYLANFGKNHIHKEKQNFDQG